MNDEELGKMSLHELESLGPDAELEIGERNDCFHDGRTGESAILTRAQVRALLLKEFRFVKDQLKIKGSDTALAYWIGAYEYINTIARLLLAIPTGVPSPLEGEKSSADEGDKEHPRGMHLEKWEREDG